MEAEIDNILAFSVSKGTQRIYNGFTRDYENKCSQWGVSPYPVNVKYLHMFLRDGIFNKEQNWVNTAICAIEHQLAIRNYKMSLRTLLNQNPLPTELSKNVPFWMNLEE